MKPTLPIGRRRFHRCLPGGPTVGTEGLSGSFAGIHIESRA